MMKARMANVAAVEGLWLMEARGTDIRALNDLLLTDEEVLLVGSGYVVREGVLAIRRWIVAATNERLLCVRRGVIAPRVITIPRKGILSVSASRSLLGWQLVVSTGHGEVRIQAGRDTCLGLQQVLATTVTMPERMSRLGSVQPDGVQLSQSARVEYLENALERLETEVARLQQQVDFLEDLMKRRDGPDGRTGAR
jgi:hypothetical protein